MNRIKCIAAAVLTAAAATACQGAGETAPDTYEIDRPPVESGAGQENGINDMLPKLSEDTRVISVEEAEKLIPRGAEDSGERTE